MLQELRNWLNGARQYTAGVKLYAQLGDNAELKSLFAQGQTPYTTKRLQDELLAICNRLKQQATQTPPPAQPQAQQQPEKEPAPKYTQLYQEAKILADNAYKQAMNKRAILFSMVDTTSYTDNNTKELVDKRAPLAIDVVKLYNRASILYARADYALQHGRMPEDDATTGQTDYDHLPDELVKPTLDNLRKNVSNMARREPTPERLAMLAMHRANITKLEARWHLLKPQK